MCGLFREITIMILLAAGAIAIYATTLAVAPHSGLSLEDARHSALYTCIAVACLAFTPPWRQWLKKGRIRSFYE